MSAGEPGGPVVEIVRYQVARLRLGQTLVPLAMLASVLARAAGGIAVYVAAALIIASAVTFALARCGFGRQPLRILRGKIEVADAAPIVPAHLGRWTMAARTARLYGKGVSWKLVAAPGDEDRLRSSLASVLGQPLLLAHRGSRRSRMVALGACAAGLALVGLSLISDGTALLMVGIVATIGGFATFGALSQKVALPSPGQ